MRENYIHSSFVARLGVDGAQSENLFAIKMSDFSPLHSSSNKSTVIMGPLS